ncbi:hypothetical protein [Pantoea stewartii]|uniref:hypothetical protein n=1 Tax=Pantoea stewartii TaxID=66269 RepID=UPI0012EB23E9|nr:hypothetical protein [Pantoea stewartii]
MESTDNELIKVVQELAESEGISFSDALDVSIKALRYEIQRRRSFLGEVANGGCSATS